MFTLTDLDLLFAPSMRWLRGPLLLVVLCLAAKVWFANRREFRKVRRCGGASRLGLICRSSVAVQWLMLASAAAFLWGALLWQAALSLLAIACAATAFHNARRRRRDAARACPRCAGMDTLKPESSGHYGGVEFVRCDRVISESPYVQCDFSYLSIYQRSPKLFLPTLGPPSSGKTLWLAMAYREMIRGCYDERISFQKLRSRFSEEFDRLVDDIINDRVGPAATQTQDFSYPLIFDFQDRDPWGKSNVLVSVFDYGGETVQTMPLDEPLRRRAFDADGYVFVSFLQACMKIFWEAGIVGCRGRSLRRTADEDEKASGRTWGSGEQPATIRAVASAS
jgi:hypothetical protein